ncbi:hypothetical protein ARMA_3140 [Ardenticatena maritima]|uniref:Aminoglycoside phosphotransferase n=1 Tax=Ardenticatena maritima TaxID=872965 RepID=A0A0M9UE60_9CHLR|nr:phosphotransferase family protein [Ardenticatena maritima]KPL89232.1 aminoglycoside phosphotransferase [Ardenticatena maritima]GAP64717.1 hypothetical protein ARMA_3140 [Ardenticatena maritima]
MAFDETIPMRPGEEIPVERLATYLRGRLPGSENPLRVRQFGGGAANLTYLLDYGTHQYVLRRPPQGPLPPSAHDMHREYRVLSVLWQAFPLAPRAFLFCEDESVIGAPFFVMERRVGVVVRREMPPQFAAIPNAARLMSAALVDALADFHAVDFAALGLSDLGKPQGFIHRQIEGWYRRWQAAQTHDLPLMDELHAWLLAHEPPEQPPTLVHNDYKLDNAMFAEDDPARLVAIFDWDMCTLGDPLSDVGALLAYWTEPDDPPHMRAMAAWIMPTGYDFMRREELVERYAQRSGRDVRHIGFYHTLGLYRIVVILAQIYKRYVAGQTQDERFAAFGTLIPLVAQAAADVAARV